MLYSDLLTTDDPTLANYTCMLLYSCVNTPGTHLDELCTSTTGVPILEQVLQHLQAHDTEWG